ncbi:MAG: type II toxin-antitoxin system VapC family toxin [Anaerolineae bacterium]
MVEIFVTDTHALVWHLFNPARLGPKATVAFQEVQQGQALLVVPLVVIAEMAMVVEKGRVSATTEQFQAVIAQMQNSTNYQISSLTLPLVLTAMQLTQLADIFDRLVVAETQAFNAKLITVDSEIAVLA